MKNFISPDGHSVRFIISHEGDPATVEGISHIDAIKQAAKEAIKGTPLEGSSIYLAGTAATYKDMKDGSFYDLLIAVIAAVTLIFIIMLIITRALVAAAVIVGTVLLSLGASFGLSVLLWQHILGLELHWMVLADVGDPAVGGGFGLQPAAGVAVQGGTARRAEDRHHPRHGGHRVGGDVRRPRLRRDDGVVLVQ